MKKSLMSFIFIILSLNINSLSNLKILIIPFKNNGTSESLIYSKIITDSIKSDLSKLPRSIEKEEFEKEILSKIKLEEDKLLILSSYELDIYGKNYIIKYDPDISTLQKTKELLSTIGYEDLYNVITAKELGLDEKMTEYNEIIKKLKKGSVDVIITGYYYEKNEKIAITFKVIDVQTGKLKTVHSTYGESSHNVFDVIYESTFQFVEKIRNQTRKEKRNIDILVRTKQSRIISGEIKENFIFFTYGIMFNTTNFVYRKKYETNIIDIASSSNNYNFAFSPIFNFEFYSSLKENYHGIGINSNIPIVYQLPNTQIVSRFTMSYIFGYKKEFFFDFAAGIFFKYYPKFKEDSDERISTTLLSVIAGFTFKYLPKRYPFYIMVGSYFLPPKFNINDLRNSNEVSLWNIATRKEEKAYVSRFNWITPVILKAGGGLFFNKEIGIYLSSSFYLMHVLYKFYYHDSYDKVGLNTAGNELSINFDIEFGFVFKNIFE